MKFLSAPWRWDFISSSGKKKGCIFCNLPKKLSRDSLICYLGDEFFVILNKYPYSSGHLMIVPYDHINSPEKISPESSIELWNLMNRAISILKKNFSPDGFNIGMNIGGAAGAGIKEHAHLHVVPRWNGDANYMGVIGNTKVVSYDIYHVYEKMKEGFSE
ncbi:MAG: HIT domain-containing protein [Candidatus Aminicenantes bacterium]|nr:HIT domain-containing protein [Candidatus Aminicenantes bacterium]